MVITTTDEYSNRDYKEGDYPTFNDIEYQAEIETYLEKNPLARVALKSIMRNTKGDISKVLQNVDDDDTSKDLYYKLKGVPIPNKGYIFPGKPEDFQQYSEEEKNNSAIVRVKLSSLDPKKQKTLTGHELGHYGLRVLLDEGRIDKKLFDKLQLADEKRPDINKEEALMHKLSSRDDFNAGTTNIGFVSNAYSNTLDSIAEDYLSGIANEDLGYAKGGDTMPMEQQMEMFAVGGLDDDGLSRDPVSGNEIPPGSMANEVRDDVDAKLSDGEYVVPANVVRFFGVKFFEDLRTQAMQGLGAMEANGRIGGEPVPSDMPMQDQMAEIQPDVSDEEMQMLQGLMNEGGYVSGYANGGTVPKDVDLENPTPFNPSPFLTVGGSYLSPNNPNVTPDPNLPPTTMPVTPSPESGISFVTMVNPATGEIQVVQFMGGNPVDANAYNQLLSSGYFVQGSQELAAYKQQQNEDNRKADDAMGGDKPKSINDLLSGDLYGDPSLGLGAKVLGSVINSVFPTKSNQQVLDFIMDNYDPVTGESRFPPSGPGIRDTTKPLMGNGKHPFKKDANGFILREEGKDGPRNVAKEEVARILATMEIKKANTKDGVLNNRAYRDALKKAGLAKGVGLTTKFVDLAKWKTTAAGIAAIKALTATKTKSKPVKTTSTLDDLIATSKIDPNKYTDSTQDVAFTVAGQDLAKQTKAIADAQRISDAAEDNNQTVADYYQENRDKAEEDRQETERQQEAENQEQQANVDASGSSSRPDNSAAAYSGSVQGKEFGRAKGGLIKKPTKKKKTKRY